MDILEEFKKKTAKWTLDDDSQLINTFENVLTHISGRATKTLGHLKELNDAVEKVDLKIDNANCNIALHSSSQFIEQRVKDDEYVRPMTITPTLTRTLAERQAFIVQDIQTAISEGMNMYHSKFRQRVDDEGFANEYMPQYEPIDRYDAFLPPLIGSTEFFSCPEITYPSSTIPVSAPSSSVISSLPAGSQPVSATVPPLLSVSVAPDGSVAPSAVSVVSKDSSLVSPVSVPIHPPPPPPSSSTVSPTSVDEKPVSSPIPPVPADMPKRVSVPVDVSIAKQEKPKKSALDYDSDDDDFEKMFAVSKPTPKRDVLEEPKMEPKTVPDKSRNSLLGGLAKEAADRVNRSKAAPGAQKERENEEDDPLFGKVSKRTVISQETKSDKATPFVSSPKNGNHTSIVEERKTSSIFPTVKKTAANRQRNSERKKFFDDSSDSDNDIFRASLKTNKPAKVLSQPPKDSLKDKKPDPIPTDRVPTASTKSTTKGGGREKEFKSVFGSDSSDNEEKPAVSTSVKRNEEAVGGTSAGKEQQKQEAKPLEEEKQKPKQELLSRDEEPIVDGTPDPLANEFVQEKAVEDEKSEETEMPLPNRAAFMDQLSAKLAARPPMKMGPRPTGPQPAMNNSQPEPEPPVVFRDSGRSSTVGIRPASVAPSSNVLHSITKDRARGPQRRPPTRKSMIVVSSSSGDEGPLPSRTSMGQTQQQPRTSPTKNAFTDELRASLSIKRQSSSDKPVNPLSRAPIGASSTLKSPPQTPRTPVSPVIPAAAVTVKGPPSPGFNSSSTARKPLSVGIPPASSVSTTSKPPSPLAPMSPGFPVPSTTAKSPSQTSATSKPPSPRRNPSVQADSFDDPLTALVNNLEKLATEPEKNTSVPSSASPTKTSTSPRSLGRSVTLTTSSSVRAPPMSTSVSSRPSNGATSRQKSLFDSDSENDSFERTFKTSKMTRSVTTDATPSQRRPPIGSTATSTTTSSKPRAAAAPQKKSIFDDSDDDLSIFRKK